MILGGVVSSVGVYWTNKLENSREKKPKKLVVISLMFIYKLKMESVDFVIEKIPIIPCDKILEYSRFYDLVILGLRTYFQLETFDKKGIFLSELLNYSVIHILAVHETYMKIKNILIAYNSNFVASKALQRFVHLAAVKDYNSILLTSSNKNDEASYNQIKAVSYFGSYGIKNIKVIIADKCINQEIKNNYIKGADLFVVVVHLKIEFKDLFCRQFNIRIDK
ncbi:hypothetical protein MNBD_IGNAVI01-2610 [hydrothermal vent metagenome]|uniref:Uncharacterized protein n=1 Tax=hydrothermal vent metagenome TaxID=652676 RepID=A0A3B1C1Y8_9ZZZZ